MATGVQAWSVTAGSNGNSDSNINWAEGQLAPTVNNSARAMMAAIRAFQLAIGGGITYGGSSNAYTATNEAVGAWASYTAGNIIALKANHTNTGAATLNVDGLGAKSIVTADGGALAAGDLVSGGLYLLAYDGTNLQVLNTIAGGSYQPLDATLTALAGVATAANKLIYATGSDTFATTDYTAGARLLDATPFTDPNADQLFFWDDSAGAFTGITTLTGMSISGTTLAVSANLQSWSAVTPSDYLTVATAQTVSNNKTFVNGAYVVWGESGNAWALGKPSTTDLVMYKDGNPYFTLGSVASFVGTPTVGSDPVMTRGAAETITGAKTVTAAFNIQSETDGILWREAGGTLRWITGLRSDITGNDNDFVFYNASTGAQTMKAVQSGDIVRFANAPQVGTDPVMTRGATETVSGPKTFTSDMLLSVTGTATLTVTSSATLSRLNFRNASTTAGFLNYDNGKKWTLFAGDSGDSATEVWSASVAQGLNIIASPTTLSTNAAGFRGVNNVTVGSSKTLALSDAGRLQVVAAGSVEITIPPQSSVAFPSGTVIPIGNGATAATIKRGSGVLLYGWDGVGTESQKTLPTQGFCSLIYTPDFGTNVWVITGNFTN